jgi:TonB-dependent SusC/RagA subfamily outer membrane receptor
LLYGIENKLGFKAVNELGHGSPVNGEIIDSKGTRITEFSSSGLGIGSVFLTPSFKETYTAIVNIGGEKPLKIIIPEAVNLGVNISTDKINDGKIRIELLTNFPADQLPPNTSYYLFGHSRGNILFTHEFDLRNQNNSVDVPVADFPSGIMHLTLFNAYSQPVSERLIFINNFDELKIKMEIGKTIASSREKMSVKMKVTDKNNQPVEGNFSVSIANKEDMLNDDNIISNLLLRSDLKGKVENPQHYFTDRNAEKEKQLDDLLLTQGWRRFSWKNVLSDIRIPPVYENEKGIIITGRVTKELLNISLRDIKVTLNILNEFNDVFTTRTGQKGVYRFENLDYQDTVSVSIEAVRASGRHNLVIYADSKEESRDKEMNYQTNQKLKRRGEKGRYTEPVDPNADDPFAKENNEIYRLHNEPTASNIIKIDESMLSYSSVGQILEGRIPGVMVTGNKVNIRGISTLYGNTDPLFLVDGMPVDADYAMGMNPNDVERIEILKGPETAIYGSRGANGVIAIYTKRGKFMKKGVLDFKMLGYATPKEYYNPGFEYRSDDPFEDDRRTILWMPIITSGLNGEASATFFTSDLKGNYTVRIEGISSKGIPGAATTDFEVK